MKIGYRTIKTAIGTPVAISIAQLFGVTNFVSAGILTILCIQPSRKRSFLTAWHRFSACILASIFSFVFFETIGYNPVVVGLMLAVFIPTTVLLKISPGIATSSVIILNSYSAGYIPVSFLIDQFWLIVVGVGTALVINLYMPSLDKPLKEKQKKLEHNFQVILYEFALYIRNKNETWDGSELTDTEDLLEEALELVEVDKENHLWRSKHPYFDYFKMRKQQFDILRKMLPLVTRLPNKDDLSEEIASFFEKLSDAVHPGNTASLYLNRLEELRAVFHKEELPVTKTEFETRANLYRLLYELENYLILKHTFKKSEGPKRKKIKKTGTAK